MIEEGTHSTSDLTKSFVMHSIWLNISQSNQFLPDANQLREIKGRFRPNFFANEHIII